MMYESEIAQLSVRVAELERTNRRYRYCALVLVVACAAGLALGLSPGIPESVRSRRFELVDPYGTVRAVIGQDKNRTVFRIHDRNGKSALQIEVGDKWRWLDIFDQAGKPNVGLHSSDGSGGEWYVSDQFGNLRGDMFVDDMGPRLRLFDNKEGLRAHFQYDDDSDASFEILDGKGNVTARFPPP